MASSPTAEKTLSSPTAELTRPKRQIFILDCPEIPCVLVLKYVFRELCQAFADNGHVVSEVSSIQDLHNNSIVFMGMSLHHKNLAELLNEVAPEAIYIGWYWYAQETSALKNFIYTYENILSPPVWRQPYFDIMQRGLNNCPLLLRASDHPSKISTYQRQVSRDYCYMGWVYRPDWVPSAPFTGLYYGTCDHNKFLDYNSRRNIYLSSTFALGFQSNENISDRHVRQRIFEGLAYGCVVFSESPEACRQTNNIVEFITSKADLESKMKFYLAHPEKIVEKQLQGYDFVRKFGTNHFAIGKFVRVIEDVLKLSV